MTVTRQHQPHTAATPGRPIAAVGARARPGTQLWQVRVQRGAGPDSYSRALGFKGRLLPHGAALRVAQRLQVSGRAWEVSLAGVWVRLSAVQMRALRRRYGPCSTWAVQ